LGETDTFILLEAVNCPREAIADIRQRPESTTDAGLLRIERRQSTPKSSEFLLKLQQTGNGSLDLCASRVRRPDKLRQFLQAPLNGLLSPVLLNDRYGLLHFILGALQLRDRCLKRAPFCDHITDLLLYFLLLPAYLLNATGQLAACIALLMIVDGFRTTGHACLESADGTFGIAMIEKLNGLLGVFLPVLQQEHVMSCAPQARLQYVRRLLLLPQLAVLHESDDDEREGHETNQGPGDLLRCR